MTRSYLAMCFLSVLLAAADAHAQPTSAYAYEWPLSLVGDSPAWQIEPTLEVYAAISDPQLRDLEVVDADGRSVAMAPRPAESAPQGMGDYADLPLFALPNPADKSAATKDTLSLRIERGNDGRLRSLDAGLSGAAPSTAVPGDFVIDASTLQAPIDRLRLDWNDSSESVSARFAVSGSDDLQSWHSLVGSAAVLSLNEAGNRLIRREIGMNGARSAYLRLQRLDDGAALAGLRVAARTIVASSPLRTERHWTMAAPVALEDRLKPTTDGAALYRYRLPASLPVEAVRLDLASDNSVARMQVASLFGDIKTGVWSTRAQFTAFRLLSSAQGGSGEIIGSDEIAIGPGPRVSEWLVQADPMLDHAPTLNLAWRPDRFVFLAQGKGPYRLVAGSASARRANYPLDIALSELHSRLGKNWQPPLAGIGARNALAGGNAYLPPAAKPRPVDWKSWLLWAVLVGAAVFIGGLAASLLRKPQS